LLESGYNELPASKPRTIFRIAVEMLREPMLLLLVACGAIYFLLGDVQEALVLAEFVFVVIGIELYQQHKTERALDALRDLSSPRALVIRDGERKRIAGREVVPGDFLVLGEGDRVPADAVLLSATNLTIDESMLTGESVPVRKMADGGEPAAQRPGGEDLPFVYSGTLVVHGSGNAEVSATGSRTELGKIGATLQSVKAEPTLLQRDTRLLVRNMATIGLSLCVIFLLIYGMTRGNWLRGFLAALTMAMSVLPEELPVVLTIFLALGAWRISRGNVLTRNTPAIETLGATTVLCVDKTGTLTTNQMEVGKLAVDGEILDVPAPSATPLPERWHRVLEYAILASDQEGFDPMDRAIHRLGKWALAGTEHLHRGWSLIRQYPLARDLLAISQVWSSPDGAQILIAAKGAPEAIMDLCHLEAARLAELSATVSRMAADGLRVLGVARAQSDVSVLPEHQHDFDFEFLGLIALADPLRATVPGAMRECATAGIRVVMITGDYPGTARSIARQAGLDKNSEPMTGADLANLGDDSLPAHIAKVRVFARTVPEQKLRIVNALKARGEIVAMTGDGVNDAPALEAAHIGVAMGARGTDVAREAADLVLLDDDFSSIVRAVRVGRRIFDNLKKATMYILAIHVPIAGLSFLPVLFGWPLILGPVHIAFLELIVDPACSVVFEAEPEEEGIMRRPPRRTDDRLVSREVVGRSLLEGAGMLFILLVIFAVAFGRGQGEDDARALTFTALIGSNLALIVANRSWSVGGTLHSRNNPAMWWVGGAAVVMLAAVLYLPYLRNLFHFSYLHPNDLALCAGAIALSFAWFESLKWFFRKKAPA